jgi:hypothetical protein
MSRRMIIATFALLAACPPPGSNPDDTGPSDSVPYNPNDEDGDGVTVGDGDCDDDNPDVYPGADEIPYDGADQDCDGEDSLDADGDGYDALWFGGDDCDDDDPDVHPGAEEVCGDGIDADCSGDPDDGSTDADGDGFVSWACTGGDDCDDSDNVIQPNRSVTVPGDYDTVAAAVAAVCSGSTVTVSAGTYAGNIDASGKAISLIGEAGASQTALAGYGDASVVIMGSEDGASLFSGFSVRGGSAQVGGGLYCTGQCTVEDSTFYNNSADYGAGLALVDADLSVASCTFWGNEAAEGSGIFIDSSSGSVSDVIFSSQSASRNGAGASVWFSQVDFSGITAQVLDAEQGAGLYLYQHEGTVTASSFNLCEAEIGGGVWNRDSTLDLNGNRFTDNYSEWGGAGYYCWDSTVTNLDTNSFEGSGLGDHNGNGTPDANDCDDYTATPCVDVGCRGCYGCP